MQTEAMPIEAERARSNIAVDIILSLVTLGIYNLFWQARQMRVVNAFLGEKRFSFWSWFFLSLVTCGLYHVYHEYVMGQTITQIQVKRGRESNPNLSMISLLLSVMGLMIVTDAIQQHEINALYD